MLHLLLAVVLSAGNLKDVNSSPVREAKKVLGGNMLVMALHYMEDNPETLEELISKDYTMLEGDIILPDDRNAVERRWQTRQIPYVISPELDTRTDHILSAMALVSAQTCVSFHNRTTEANYLLFKTSKGCASYVGFIGGEQPVFIGPPCMVGNIAHEILHALGFHHEHTRMDRQRYITVLSQNIMAGMEENFKKRQGQTFDLPYDITSILHYGRGFFSANGQPTIVANNEAKEMGQRVKMTKMDNERVGHLYNCDEVKKQTEEKSSDAEKEEDENTGVVIQSDDVSLSSTGSGNQSHVPAPKPGERLAPAAPATPPSLQHLDAAAGGRNHTGGQRQQA